MKFLTANAHWLLRIALASVFIYHGVLKFQNLEGFAQMLPISYLQVVLVALAETGGGLLVLVGGVGRDRISEVEITPGVTGSQFSLLRPGRPASLKNISRA